jgi:hypothetical protein
MRKLHCNHEEDWRMSRVNIIGVMGCLGFAVTIGCVDSPAPEAADRAAQLAPPAQTDTLHEQATSEVLADSDYTLHWCDPASPSVGVSKSIFCEACSKSEAEDCAQKWAGITAGDFCDGAISTAGGAADCAPAHYDGGTCVDTTSSGITSEVQFGSDTACGVWPFRHAKWRVTYNVTGDCGYPCSEAI